MKKAIAISGVFIVIILALSIISGKFSDDYTSNSANNSSIEEFSPDDLEFVCDKPKLKAYNPENEGYNVNLKEGQHYYSVSVKIINHYNRRIRLLQDDDTDNTADKANLTYHCYTLPYEFDIDSGDSYENAVYMKFVYPENTTDEEALNDIYSNFWDVSFHVYAFRDEDNIDMDNPHDSDFIKLGNHTWTLKVNSDDAK